MAVVKVTEKGQVTIPIELRRALGITEGCYLEVAVEGHEIRLQKVVSARPLSSDDPIWKLLGMGASGQQDVSQEHDRYLAEGEQARWRESS